MGFRSNTERIADEGVFGGFVQVEALGLHDFDGADFQCSEEV